MAVYEFTWSIVDDPCHILVLLHISRSKIYERSETLRSEEGDTDIQCITSCPQLVFSLGGKKTEVKI